MNTTAVRWTSLAAAVLLGPVALVAFGSGGEDKAPASLANSLGMKFVAIPAGTFKMGTPFTESQRSSDESPHEITLTKSFHLGVFEVTQAEYARVISSNPSHFTPASRGDLKDTGRFPVEQVSWDEAVAFCDKLGAVAEEKNAGRTYRLPTEAEWECACRGGAAGEPFHFGVSLGAADANFQAQYPYGKAAAGAALGRTTPVGAYKPNAFGLHDMHGNVWEWCLDKYDRDYYLNSPAKDPLGPRNPERRLVRGGSWRNDAVRCRSGFRGKQLPNVNLDNVGFRVVMVPAEPAADAR